MMRAAAVATGSAVVVCALSACGGGQKQAQQTVTAVSRAAVSSARVGDVLSLSGFGTFEGLCPRGGRRWKLRFINPGFATDTISYRIGTGSRRTQNVNPGTTITFGLVPGAARTHEPRFSPPAGQGHGRTGATTVSSTAPLEVTIYQSTEPQTLRADVRIALTTIGGESGRCVLVGSTVNAHTYPNS
jgi:hypothetical protein